MRKSSIIDLAENSTTPTVTSQVEYTYPDTTGEDKTVNTTTTDDSAPETGTVSPPMKKKGVNFFVYCGVCIFVCV